MNERRRFAQNSHEYLIEQVQTDNNYSVSYDSGNIMKNMQLTFNHPVKELIWCLRINGNTPDVFNFTNKTRTVSNGDYDKPVLGYMDEISKDCYFDESFEKLLSLDKLQNDDKEE